MEWSTGAYNVDIKSTASPYQFLLGQDVWSYLPSQKCFLLSSGRVIPLSDVSVDGSEVNFQALVKSVWENISVDVVPTVAKATYKNNLASKQSGAVKSPMTGAVVSSPKVTGDSVAKGDVVLVIEAMKMENEVKAPEGGFISLFVSSGERVEIGTLLFEVS